MSNNQVHPTFSDPRGSLSMSRPPRLRIWGGLLALTVLSSGCERKEESRYVSVSRPQPIQVVKPTERTIVRTVGQPSFIESYERTSIYPKLTGYIEKWNVDIGDKVKKGDVLAKLFVPELVEDFGTKKATVVLDQRRVELAEKLVQVAEADLKASQAALSEARSILGKYSAEVERWDIEVKRLDREVKRNVVDPQILLESTNQLKSSTAAREAAQASIDKAQADVLSREAALAKAQVDVHVAQADLAVAESDKKRIEAWVGYITLPAPYDGIIVTRNANTGDFVQPTSGDPTALQRSPNLSPSGLAAPIYTVDRTDVVRIFVDVPEQDANYVQVGTKASVLARAFSDEPVLGSVTRTSWALNIKSRTLRAEVDLPNPESHLLPGMYAYAKILIERPNTKAVPAEALVRSGDQVFCWLYRDGKAYRHEVRTGINDGDWYELTDLRSDNITKSDDGWKPIDGSEQVILGDLSILAEAEPVEIISPASEKTSASAGETASKNPTK